jgi:DivIVA domain-containing protein
MDRSSIQRSDFPTARRGYEPAAVDAHLREVADAVEGGRQPVAAAASAQVQRIIEAAETSAEQLRTEAGEEAREHVHRISTAARELLERIGAMHDELGEIMDRLREDAGRLSAELRTLERDVVEVGPGEPPLELEPVELDEPEPETDPERIAAARRTGAKKAAPKPPADEPEPETDPERIAAAAKARAKAPPERSDDEEAARLVALDMALAGTPREETERYLAEHYALPDPGRLLDDVYALAGS